MHSLHYIISTYHHHFTTTSPCTTTKAELWGSVVLSLLFWGFANDINTVDEAKSYYPLFGLVANLALILSGQYVRWTSVIRAGLPDGVDKWGHSLKVHMH